MYHKTFLIDNLTFNTKTPFNYKWSLTDFSAFHPIYYLTGHVHKKVRYSFLCVCFLRNELLCFLRSVMLS